MSHDTKAHDMTAHKHPKARGLVHRPGPGELGRLLFLLAATLPFLVRILAP